MNPITFEGILCGVEAETSVDVSNLMVYLAQIPDPRAARGVRYRLVDLLTLLVLAKLGGEDSLRGMAEWVKLRGSELVQLLNLPRNSLPHQTTYERMLAKLDVEVVEQQVGAYFAAHSPAEGTINIDGKTLRGSIPAGETQGVHLLSAYATRPGVVLQQCEVDGKANEISTAPQLLASLDLRGKLVTGDAMFTQRSLCDQIVTAGGDYLLAVKANQPHLLEAIAESFLPPPPNHGYPQPPLPTASAETVTKGHGRLVYRFLDAHSHLVDYLDWPHLAQVFRLQRIRQDPKTGLLNYELCFGITSAAHDQMPPECLLDQTRQHWHIENRLHYVRDVTFHEDACQIRHTKRQTILAALNNLAIGLIRQCDFDFVPDARRYFDLHYQEAYQLLCS